MAVDPYVDGITLENGDLKLVLAPRLGASIVAFERVGAEQSVEIFRRTSHSIESALECAMPVMLPWINRISAGGITVEGKFHPIAPNIPGEPFPNHGNGFQSEWQVLSQSQTSVILGLSSAGPGPYVYDASYELGLDGPMLTARIELVNRADKTLPFGIGFHPWFPRTPGTTLAACATEVWLEDERYIPTRPVPVDQMPDFDFREAKSLPEHWINNSFVGWNGVAEIVWPDRQLRLLVNSPDAACYHVYSPNDRAGFFCFETETHIPDAARLLEAGRAGAPHWLQTGEALVHEVRFTVTS